MQQETTAVNIFINPYSSGSRILRKTFVFFPMVVCLICPVSHRSSTSPSLHCLVQCRVSCTTAKCWHWGDDREITDLETACSAPGHSTMWGRRHPAPSLLLSSTATFKMKLCYPLALKPKQMLFPSLRSGHSGSHPLNVWCSSSKQHVSKRP